MTGSSSKPAGLTSAVVMAIVLAAFEAMNGLAVLAGFAAMEKMRETFTSFAPPALSGDVAEQFTRLQSRMMEVMNPRLALVQAALTLPVAVWTIVTAFRLNRGRPGAARGFSHAVTALAAVEVLGLAYAIHAQQQMRPFFKELMSIDIPSHPDGAQIVQTVKTFMEAAMLGAFLFSLAFAAGKVFCCLYARRIARKPEVQAWTPAR